MGDDNTGADAPQQPVVPSSDGGAPVSTPDPMGQGGDAGVQTPPQMPQEGGEDEDAGGEEAPETGASEPGEAPADPNAQA